MDPILDGLIGLEPGPGREGFFIVHGDGFCREFHEELCHLIVLLSNKRVKVKVFEEDENDDVLDVKGKVGVIGDGGLVEHELAALGGLLEKDGVA